MHIVYGGSFNPPTKAHREVVEFLLEQCTPRRITLVPVGQAYQKEALEADAHRLEMTRVAFDDLAAVKVSDIECFDATFKGSYETLKRLDDGGDLAFVIGADHLKSLHTWINIKQMLTSYKMIVLNRDATPVETLINNNDLLKHYKQRFIVFESFDAPMSASQYRKTKDASLIDARVAEYIRTHNLYEG